MRFTTFDERDKSQLRENDVWALAESDDASLWIGIYGGGLSRYKDGKFTVYTTAAGLINDYVASLCTDRDGAIWIGTDGGLSRFKDGTFTNYTVKDGLAHNAVRGLYADRDGTVWIGTNCGGLNTVRNGRISAVSIDGLAPRGEVSSFARDKDEALWIAGGGLNRLKDGKFTRYTDKDGLASNGIQTLYLDRDNVLWIATRQGLNRFKNGAFTTYTVNDGLYSSFVYTIVEDDHGTLWMNCSKGVFRVGKQELNDFAAGKRKSVRSVVFGLEHGLSSTVGTVGHYPGGVKTSDGRIWFCMVGGVGVVDPTKLSTNTLPPPVHIEDVSVDQRVFPSNQMGCGARTRRPGLPLHGTQFPGAGKSAIQVQAERVRPRLGGCRRAAGRLLQQHPAGALHLPREGGEQRRRLERDRRQLCREHRAALLSDRVVLHRLRLRGGPGCIGRVPGPHQEPEDPRATARPRRGPAHTRARGTAHVPSQGHRPQSQLHFREGAIRAFHARQSGIGARVRHDRGQSDRAQAIASAVWPRGWTPICRNRSRSTRSA